MYFILHLKTKLFSKKRDISQSRLSRKLLVKDHANYHEEDDILNINIFNGSNEWFLLALDEGISAFEEHDVDELGRVHSEIHATLTPIQNDIFLELIEQSKL